MKISKDHVIGATLDNNTTFIVDMLEAFGFYEDDTVPDFDSERKCLVSTILTSASMSARNNNLDKELAEELIERTARVIDIFSFLRFVDVEAKFKKEYDFNAINQIVRMSFRSPDLYDERMTYVIKNMCEEEFNALLAYFFVGEFDECNAGFNPPIIHRIYSDEIIPADLLFALMATSLMETFEERLGNAVFDAVEGFLAFSE